VTEIDVASQRSIESTIMSNFPLHGFLGEESVEAGHCASVGMINSSFRYWSTAF
jgi:fructose-1,6-bisphosphatase/inositol monophosphatase family enzyme